jgi:hypothetical protein
MVITRGQQAHDGLGTPDGDRENPTPIRGDRRGGGRGRAQIRVQPRQPARAAAPLGAPVLDFVALANEAARAQAAYPPWMTKVGDLAFLRGLDPSLSVASLSAAVSELKIAMADPAIELNFDQLLERIPGRVLRYLTRIIVLDLDKKKTIRTMRLISMYKDLQLLNTDLAGAWGDCGFELAVPADSYTWLCSLDRSDRLTDALRERLAARTRRVRLIH